MPTITALAMGPSPMPRTLRGSRQARTPSATSWTSVAQSHNPSSPRPKLRARASACPLKKRCSSKPERCSDGTLVRASSHAQTHHTAAANASVAPFVMRVAVISDVHSNLSALEAVLTDIDGEGVDEVWCLGDIVGYGARPNECCDLVRERAALSLCGNHDLAVLGSLEVTEFAGDAGRAARWTAEVLGAEQRAWLESLRPLAERGDAQLFHAQPTRPGLGVRAERGDRPGRLPRDAGADRPRRPQPRRTRALVAGRSPRRRPRAGRDRARAGGRRACCSTPARSASLATATRARRGCCSTTSRSALPSAASTMTSRRRRARSASAGCPRGSRRAFSTASSTAAVVSPSCSPAAAAGTQPCRRSRTPMLLRLPHSPAALRPKASVHRPATSARCTAARSRSSTRGVSRPRCKSRFSPASQRSPQKRPPAAPARPHHAPCRPRVRRPRPERWHRCRTPQASDARRGTSNAGSRLTRKRARALRSRARRHRT